jgi:hypothetical protein
MLQNSPNEMKHGFHYFTSPLDLDELDAGELAEGLPVGGVVA